VTVAEALSAIRRVGTVDNYAGKLGLRFPETAAFELQPAVDTLRAGKAEALALLSDPAPSPPTAKGYPVLPPNGCPACGGWTFRLEESLWACDACTPLDAEVIRDKDVAWVQRSAAVGILNERGVRIIETGGPERFRLGVWRDLDSNELREALRVLRLDRFPLRYLEDLSIPEKYRQYRPKQKQGQLSQLARGNHER
jgi:hypothetical protein